MSAAQLCQIESKILNIAKQQVMLDADIADLYGVETKRINEAVKNNPEKFPADFMFELNQQDKNDLVENFDRFSKLKHSSVLPKAFTEQGVYMLATVLKSKQAVDVTLLIIRTFANLRQFATHHSNLIGRIEQLELQLASYQANKSLLLSHSHQISELQAIINELAPRNIDDAIFGG